MKYNLYVDCSCIEETNSYDEACILYEQACKDYPDSVIDILSEDGETSYMGIN
jgi:hypothetical protein